MEASGGAAGSSGSGGKSPGSGGASSSSGGESTTTGGGASTGGTGGPTGGDGGSSVEDPDAGTGGTPSSGGAPAGSGGASPATGGKPPATGGAPAGPKCGTDYNDNAACNTCMTSKCCNQLKACVPNSPCEKFLECAVKNCPKFESLCLQLSCSSVSAGAQPAADLIECRQDCTTECPIGG